MKNLFLLIIFCLLTYSYSYSQCDMIEKEVDDFTGEIKFRSPYMDMGQKFIAPAIIIKSIKDSDTSYYLMLNTYSNSYVVDGKGAIILFTDETKLEKPEQKIDVHAGDNGFKYLAFIPLTNADLIELSTKTINKFRLYIYDGKLGKPESDRFLISVNCILEK